MGNARTYSDEFKADAVKLLKEMNMKKAAERLGIAPSTIRGWYLKSLGTSTPAKLDSTEELSYEELLKKIKNLEKENRYMHEINRVLKKSLGIMGQDNLDSLKK